MITFRSSNCFLTPVVALLCAVLLFGCVPTTPIPPQPDPSATPDAPDETPLAANPLENSEWILVSLRGAPPLEGSRITLRFEDNRSGGTAGCNDYGGRYTVDGNRLRFNELSRNLMLCNDEALMNQEERYLEVLSDAAVTSPAVFALFSEPAGARLELRDALGVPVLVYTQMEALAMNPQDLIGTAWRWVSTGPGPGAANVQLPEGTQPRLAFVDENEVIGFAGCRHFYGTYLAPREDNIAFTSTFMLGQDCSANEALNRQESEFTDFLSNSTDFALDVEKTRLDLLLKDGQTVSFLRIDPTPPAQIEGVDWHLAALFRAQTDPQDPIRLPLEPLLETEITLRMDEGQADGSAGCNRYFSEYTRTENSLSFAPPGATKMFCAEPEQRMQQEQQFLETLPRVNDFQIVENMLWMTTVDGQALLFIQAQ